MSVGNVGPFLRVQFHGPRLILSQIFLNSLVSSREARTSHIRSARPEYLSGERGARRTVALMQQVDAAQ
jgi:hypothetical protein